METGCESKREAQEVFTEYAGDRSYTHDFVLRKIREIKSEFRLNVRTHVDLTARKM